MNLMDTILSNLEDLCKPIIVCDDSGSSAINFKDFSFSPDDIILTDGYINYCNEQATTDSGSEYISMSSRCHNASYICIFEKSRDKFELFVSMQRFNNDKAIELREKIEYFINNRTDIENYVISKYALPEFITI